MVVSVNQAVSNASNQPIIHAGAARIGAGVSAWPFLPQINRIIDKLVRSRENQAYSLQSTLHPYNNDFADYLALATCGHMLDGWRYLSQSAFSLLSGARSHALHLAYYAELRAALSILAGSGIGILNQIHFAFNQTGSVDLFTGSTHPTAWAALGSWSNQSVNASKVIDCFSALNIPANDWANACNVNPSLSCITTEWLKNWSADLNVFTKDRELRNNASYRPNFCSDAFNPLADHELHLIKNISSGCAFSGNGHFNDIDLLLIHDLCNKAYRLLVGPSAGTQTKKSFIKNVVQSLQSSGKMDEALAKQAIILFNDPSKIISSDVIRYANVSNATVIGVVSRAFLLLRLSSALVRQQWIEMRRIRSATISANWEDATLKAFGLWSNLLESSNLPEEYEMLDADRVEAEQNITSWLQNNKPMEPFRMWRDIPKDLVELCRFERIGLLAVAP